MQREKKKKKYPAARVERSHGQLPPLQRSSPFSPRGENRLKRGESFLIPREDRASRLVFFINKNYEKNRDSPNYFRVTRYVENAPANGCAREGERHSTPGSRQLGKPVYGFSPTFFVPTKTESSRTQISLQPFPTTASNEY